YKTGDLARFLADGNIDYLGRLDHQVKLRGLRIELGEIEAALTQHSAVSQAIVMAREDVPNQRRLVAYLHTHADKLVAELKPGADRTADWGDIWNQIYEQPAVSEDETFNTVGWTSSYDRQAIPEHEMQEWVGETVERILGLKPEGVLEIGCGTGLLLHRIAPHCNRYYGSDISDIVIGKLAAQLRADELQGADVRLFAYPADRLAEIPAAGFDTVIINSVAQYFPNFAYLQDVLAAAIGKIGAQGRIFLGDIRHFGLHKVFHSSVALHHAPQYKLGQVRQAAARGLNRETELLVDPAYFHSLRAAFPQISRIETLPKRGQALNEMTRYRFDVVITIGEVPSHSAPVWQAWSELRQDMAELEAQLAQGVEQLAIKGIADERVAYDVAAHAKLAELGEEATVADLRRVLSAEQTIGVARDALELLARQHGYRLHLQSASGSQGHLHAVFTRTDRVIDWSELYKGEVQYANQPLPSQFHAMLQKSIVQHLRRTLPEYMVPTHFMVLDEMPLTSNGKVDRKALPAPDTARADGGYVAPSTRIEKKMAEIWAAVLHLDRVGIHDNFFELGGHSLLAIGLIERMRDAGMETTVRALFAAPTIAGVLPALGREERAVEVPPNLIPANSRVITPAMLTLADLDEDEIANVVAAVPGGAANIQDIYPLAPLQEGILFHYLVQERGDVYLLPTLLAFDERARLDAFVHALQKVIARHDILRTAIAWEGLREPVQVVWRQAQALVEEVSFDRRDGDIAAQLKARFNPGHYRIDARQAPLTRVFLAHDPVNQRWLLQVMQHHFASDHATLEIIIEEIQAILADEEASLPPPVPFRHFVAQARLGPSPEEHEEFFREMLADIDEPTAPFGLVGVQGDWASMTEASRHIGVGLGNRIRRQTRKLGVSPASLMHLAWAQVLARLTGRRDVVFGTVLFGRMRGGADVDRAPGVFINTLPIRLVVGQESVAQGVRHTHALLTRLVNHEHAPLALAQRCSGIEAPTPLFTALLNYRHSTLGEALNTHEAWRGMENLGTEESTNYPVTLSVDDFGDDFLLFVQVNAQAQPERVCSYMQTALENLVEALEQSPHMPAVAVEVLPPQEREQLLVEWNSTAHAHAQEYEHAQTLHGLFEQQALHCPETEAVKFAGQSLTYRELNARANRLAHYLRGQGVGADSLVGICVERSVEMV
ncbi:condensation domain-containing protein, partial [Janthinobacterium sp. SUN120]|uniref:condensation domain-containing protein n=2 Tax=unclassified Janthinobacterium TaxID=2610881 RepID=UPI0025AF30A7